MLTLNRTIPLTGFAVLVSITYGAAALGWLVTYHLGRRLNAWLRSVAVTTAPSEATDGE